jgi:hypothetical protein
LFEYWRLLQRLEKNLPPPYPLPSREGKYDGFGLMLMQFKFAIKDVSKFLVIVIDIISGLNIIELCHSGTAANSLLRHIPLRFLIHPAHLFIFYWARYG